MMNRIMKMFLGITIASIGIALTLNSDIGCFVETGAYKGVANLLGIPLFASNILFQIVMIAIATYYGEGLGWTAIVNATYGAVVVNIVHDIVPHNPWLLFGAFLIPFGWSILEKARYGSTGTNILMKALMVASGKSLFIVRTSIELTFLLIVVLTAPQYATWVTIAGTFGAPLVLKYVYKLVGHKPAEIKHDFIISKRNN